ncbi:MAG: ComEC/Rec2 family competence protein [Jejuia sp.]
MKLLNFTIIKLTFFLILGIVLGYSFEIPTPISLIITASLLVVLTFLYFKNKHQFQQNIWFGLFAYLSMSCVGALTVSVHDQKNHADHYTQFLDSEKANDYHNITFRIREILKPGNYYDKYIIDLIKIDGAATQGKSLLNIKKDSLSSPLQVDDVFVVKTNIKNLIHPLNPGQFDYKNYLRKQYIYHQLFVDTGGLLKGTSTKTTLLGIANSIRSHINFKLKDYNFKEDELAIINALLLGQRQEINEEVYKSYTNAGAIHILAISGLHIGVILIFLNHIFRPLERLKRGKLLKAVVLIFILWSFAIIAGLSASVTRAVTMFSIVTIGMHLKRPTNIYNTLAISILILLLFKPLFIFDVGFQLSYAAVFAIVTLDPLFYKLWQPKKWLLNLYWHTFTITIAAQFGIIPISLYYFHQFPGLFFISNLVIIPILGIILGFGILIILLAVLNLLPNSIASIFGSIIGWMNNFVKWVAQQEAFLFKDISFSLLYVLVFYILIISFFTLFFKRNFKSLRTLLIAVILLQSAFIITAYKNPNQQLIVFHKSRYTLIGQVLNNELKVASDFDSITKAKNNIIRDFKVEQHISKITEDTIASTYILNDTKLLVVDSLGIYVINSFKPDYVLLRQSPKINLNRLINTLQPKQIIADGSNYKSYIEHWEDICKKSKLPFHQTSKKGAFIID